MNEETIQLMEVSASDYLAFISKERNTRETNKTLCDDTDMLLEEVPYDHVCNTHSQSRRYFFISVGSIIVGYLIVLRNNQNFLDGLYISPKFRKKGIATESVKLSGTNVCMVKSHNNPAIGLYKKLGFIVHKILEEYGERQDTVSGTMFKYQIMKKM